MDGAAAGFATVVVAPALDCTGAAGLAGAAGAAVERPATGVDDVVTVGFGTVTFTGRTVACVDDGVVATAGFTVAELVAAAETPPVTAGVAGTAAFGVAVCGAAVTEPVACTCDAEDEVLACIFAVFAIIALIAAATAAAVEPGANFSWSAEGDVICCNKEDAINGVCGCCSLGRRGFTTFSVGFSQLSRSTISRPPTTICCVLGRRFRRFFGGSIMEAAVVVVTAVEVAGTGKAPGLTAALVGAGKAPGLAAAVAGVGKAPGLAATPAAVGKATGLAVALEGVGKAPGFAATLVPTPGALTVRCRLAAVVDGCALVVDRFNVTVGIVDFAPTDANARGRWDTRIEFVP